MHEEDAQSQPTPVRVLYQNWEGIFKWRKILPRRLYWGSTEFHPEEQWLLEVWDVDKAAQRTFALKDCLVWDFTKEK